MKAKVSYNKKKNWCNPSLVNLSVKETQIGTFNFVAEGITRELTFGTVTGSRS